MSIKQLKLIALFMSSLMIMIPMYSASILAYTGIKRIEASGQDGIEGYIRNEDAIDFRVIANIDDDLDGVTSDQVKIPEAAVEFSSCMPGLEGYECELRLPDTGTWTYRDLNRIPVLLYDEGDNQVGGRTATLVVDNNAPDVRFFSILPKLTSSGDMTFTYSVEDYAYRKGDSSRCVGLDRIVFYTFDSSFVEQVNIDTDDCDVSGSVSVDNSILPEGGNVIYVKAVDKFEQESEPEEDSIVIDRTAPVIGSLKIVDTNGNSIDYIGSDTIKGEVIVNISGPGLDTNSVAGDFSELNYERGNYKNLRAVICNVLHDTALCSWSVELKLDSGGMKYMTINASDNVGNKATVSLSKGFVFDDAGPVINGITTDKIHGGISYASSQDNTFVASISEPGVGVDASNVFLHIGSLFLPADSCEADACYWYEVGIGQEGSVRVWIGDDTTDRLGNAAEEFSTDIIVDATKPALTSLNVKTIGGVLPAYRYVKTFDSLEITAEIVEANVITEAYGDFSSIIDGADKVLADECTKTDGTYTCKWTTDPIDVEGYIDSSIDFSFIDISGNVLTASAPVEVYELIDTELDYWKHDVSCSPELIDRQTTALVNHRIYCHIGLSGNAETIDINLEGCDGPTEYLEEAPVLFNDEIGSTDPYLKFTLRAEELTISELEFDCKLRIVSKISERITRYPEVENVSIQIGFYNLPLGEYGAGVDKKIEDAKEFAWYIGDWVEDVNEILHYGQAICNMANSLIKLFGGLSAIGSALSLLGTTSKTADEVRKEVQRAQQGVSGLTKEQWAKSEGFNKFCKFFSCRLYYDDAFEGPTAEAIGKWQRTVLERANWVSTGGGKIRAIEAWSNKENRNKMNIYTGKLNPKESIVISTLTLCLPGIVYNLNKLRQIQCMYVDCMQTYATQGLPLKACEDQKEYATCKYWWGEIFQLLPFTGLWNEMIGMVKKALSSPFGFIDIVLGYVCRPLYEKDKMGGPAAICLINDIAGLIADVASDLEGIGDQWEIKDDYCDNI
ncbi:hypothetical protein KY360_05420 [Candidatus Woesearchaeota archaeon]|nr:hypothetical protein [Candidatus Woesearchaeota archaeon]